MEAFEAHRESGEQPEQNTRNPKHNMRLPLSTGELDIGHLPFCSMALVQSDRLNHVLSATGK